MRCGVPLFLMTLFFPSLSIVVARCTDGFPERPCSCNFLNLLLHPILLLPCPSYPAHKIPPRPRSHRDRPCHGRPVHHGTIGSGRVLHSGLPRPGCERKKKKRCGTTQVLGCLGLFGEKRARNWVPTKARYNSSAVAAPL